MSKNDVSFKRGLPLYVTGFACIATGLFSLSTYSGPSWYGALTGILAFIAGILAFIAAGLMLFFGWLMQMGMDTKDYDNGSGGGDAFFLINLLHKFGLGRSSNISLKNCFVNFVKCS